MPLARKLARRYRHSGEPLEDLEQVAYLALVKCVDRYRSDRGPIQAYIVSCVLGELKRHFRDHGWALHVPRGAKENYGRVKSIIEDFTSEQGSMPSPREIATACGLDLELVIEALELQSAYSPRSLDAPTNFSDADSPKLVEALGADDERFAIIDELASAAPAFAELPPREQRILHMRFAEDLTQVQIAKRVGLSQMHVSRLIRDSLAKLHGSLHEAA